MDHLLRCYALTVAIIGSAGAYATPFTNEAAFQAAATGYALETFDSIAAGTGIGELASLGITFADQGDGLPGVFPYSQSVGASPKSQPNNLGNRPSFDILSTQSWVFSASGGGLVTAVGLWNIGTDDNMWLRFLDAQNNVIEQTLILGGPARFGGIVNAVGATSVRIDHTGAGNGLMGLDDLQVALAHSVPEPGTTGLLFAALAGGGAARRLARGTSPRTMASGRR